MHDARGNRYWVVWTNRGICDPAGRITEVLSIGTDITELKRVRVELARQRDELAELNDFIRRVFGRYVSDAVVRRLLDSPEGLEVGGTTRCVSILVADVRGFSTICDDLRPDEVIAMLNTYLEVMTGVIERYDGTIDEFIGDAILVLFGAPIAIEDHASRAVACALAMQRGMHEVNRRNHGRGLPALEIGIGIHTGIVVAGNIGCAKRAKYGVVGASMNLASRIESYTVGGQILISEETRRRAGEGLLLGSFHRVEPKGVRAPIAVHELLGIRGDPALDLPRDHPADAEPVDLPCRYCVMEEKFVGRTRFSGRIIALSGSGATLLPETALPLLANLKIQLADGVDLHAKVVATEPDAEPMPAELRFTSLSSAARRHLSDLKAALVRN
jgi:adenylate cyclase